jgi:hypothetical protein
LIGRARAVRLVIAYIFYVPRATPSVLDDATPCEH